jgi:hypothetical protein
MFPNGPCTRRITTAFAAVLLLSTTLLAQNDKRFFVGPTPKGGLKSYKQLFEPGSDWSWVQRQATVFELHIAELMPSTPNLPAILDDAVLQQAIATLDAAKMSTGLITGGLRPYPGSQDPSKWGIAGEYQSGRDYQGMKRWVALGGKLDVLMFDSPFSKMLASSGMPWSVAASELADYLDNVRSVYPDIEYGFIEPVPNFTFQNFTTWGNKNDGDLGVLIDTVLPILTARGHTPSFFLADSPYYFNETTPFGWRKLRDVQRLVHQKGLRFGVFVNDYAGGTSSSQLFYENSSKFLARFHAVGGVIDDFNFRSWYEYPKVSVPESEPYSFMWTAKELLREALATYVAPNSRSVTLGFDDGQLGALDPVGGSYQVVGGALELLSDAEFSIDAPAYTRPKVALGVSMHGMDPGDATSVFLDPSTGPWRYRVSVLGDAAGKSRVELHAVHRTQPIEQFLAGGHKVPHDVLGRPFHFTVELDRGRVKAEINRNVALDVVSPAPLGATLALGLAGSGPGVLGGRARIDYVDVREGDAVTSVAIDAAGHVLLSMSAPDLVANFDPTYYLGVAAGETLEFAEFVQSFLPALEIESLRDNHLLLRSKMPVPSGTLIGLLYDRDFESAEAP